MILDKDKKYFIEFIKSFKYITREQLKKIKEKFNPNKEKTKKKKPFILLNNGTLKIYISLENEENVDIITLHTEILKLLKKDKEKN